MKPKLAALALGAALISGVAVAPAAQAAAPQVASQPSWCGWRPANNSHDPGTVSYSYVNIRSGQSTQCNVIGGASSGQWVTVRCYIYNTTGEEWYYIDGPVTGWVIANSVYAGWSPVQC
ncbi:SH3 domain-containing protein [Streptomyces sp. NPDC004393]|uniref:SH3 domain-containing protein n=1 Tax=Streptomyces sp. NPDC004533 TaxID=3154278 RepID=UPI0033B35C7A